MTRMSLVASATKEVPHQPPCCPATGPNINMSPRVQPPRNAPPARFRKPDHRSQILSSSSAIHHHLLQIRLSPRYCDQAHLRTFPFLISSYNAKLSAKCSVDGILPHKMAATRALETGLQRMSITDENDPGETGRIYQKSKVSSNSHSP